MRKRLLSESPFKTSEFILLPAFLPDWIKNKRKDWWRMLCQGKEDSHLYYTILEYALVKGKEILIFPQHSGGLHEQSLLHFSIYLPCEHLLIIYYVHFLLRAQLIHWKKKPALILLTLVLYLVSSKTLTNNVCVWKGQIFFSHSAHWRGASQSLSLLHLTLNFRTRLILLWFL